MENAFECTYYDSEELLSEYYYKVRMHSRIVLGWVFAGITLVAVVMSLRTRSLRWILYMLLFGGYAFYSFIYPYWMAKKEMKEIRKRNNGQIPPAFIEFCESITHRYKQSTIVMPYEELCKVYFLKHSISLWGTEWAITIERDGFTKGKPEEFKQFLQEKQPSVKFIYKD